MKQLKYYKSMKISNKQVKIARFHSLGLFKSGALASLLKSPLL